MIVPDEIVIGFFTATVCGMAAAIGVLWKRVVEVQRDRDKKDVQDAKDDRDKDRDKEH